MGEMILGEVAALEQRVDEREPGRRSVAHRDGHGAIQLDDGRRLEPQQEVVPGDDLRPVRGGGLRSRGVNGVALNDAGDPRRALQVLETALKRQPNDRDLLSGLAVYADKAGQRDAAIGYAKRLVTLDPENREYAQLAARLEGRTAN